jgi:tellurite resistance protein
MIELLSSRYGERSSVIMEHLSSSVMALADRPNIAQTLNGVAKDLTADEKYEIFLLAVDIAMADGILDQGETQAILFAGQILGLPQNTIYSEIRKISSNN